MSVLSDFDGREEHGAVPMLTIAAALIGVCGMLIAGYLGHRVGRSERRGERRREAWTTWVTAAQEFADTHSAWGAMYAAKFSPAGDVEWKEEYEEALDEKSRLAFSASLRLRDGLVRVRLAQEPSEDTRRAVTLTKTLRGSTVLFAPSCGGTNRDNLDRFWETFNAAERELEEFQDRLGALLDQL